VIADSLFPDGYLFRDCNKMSHQPISHHLAIEPAGGLTSTHSNGGTGSSLHGTMYRAPTLRAHRQHFECHPGSIFAECSNVVDRVRRVSRNNVLFFPAPTPLEPSRRRGIRCRERLGGLLRYSRAA
jgi:hypothetical protein